MEGWRVRKAGPTQPLPPCPHAASPPCLGCWGTCPRCWGAFTFCVPVWNWPLIRVSKLRFSLVALVLSEPFPVQEVCYLWRFGSAQKQVREGRSQSLPHTAKPDTLGPPQSLHSGLWSRQQRLVPDPGWLSPSLAFHYLLLQRELSSRVGKLYSGKNKA